MTSNSKAEGRFGKQDFRYVVEEDLYVCPAGERLTYYYTSEERAGRAPLLDQRPPALCHQAQLHHGQRAAG